MHTSMVRAAAGAAIVGGLIAGAGLSAGVASAAPGGPGGPGGPGRPGGPPPPPYDGPGGFGGPGAGYGTPPPPPPWAPFAQVFWDPVRQSWGFYNGPIWFPL